MTPDQTDLDLIIIGGGPAGLTAGLYAARANMKTVLLDSKDVGGEILNTELIEDYPGFESVTGADLARKMADHALKFGLRIETYKPVKQIRSDGDRKIVELEDGTELSAYAVIVTVGGEPTKLGIAGEKEYHGRGVSYCAVCDGAFFKGQELAVVGGGDAAVEEGDFLTRYASRVYVIHRRNEFRAQPILLDRARANPKIEFILDSHVQSIVGDEKVRGLRYERQGKDTELAVGGVFIFVGFVPNSKLLKVHVDHDEAGYILTDRNMQTSVPGIWAVGDVRAQLTKQISTAVGDGTTAAVAASAYVSAQKHAARA